MPDQKIAQAPSKKPLVVQAASQGVTDGWGTPRLDMEEGILCTAEKDKGIPLHTLKFPKNQAIRRAMSPERERYKTKERKKERRRETK